MKWTHQILCYQALGSALCSVLIHEAADFNLPMKEWKRRLALWQDLNRSMDEWLSWVP